MDYAKECSFKKDGLRRTYQGRPDSSFQKEDFVGEAQHSRVMEIRNQVRDTISDIKIILLSRSNKRMLINYG
jgi:hypothetical protein